MHDPPILSIAIGLAVGIGFIMTFAMIFPLAKTSHPAERFPNVSIVTIPEGASLPNGTGFEPKVISVVIGTNNTVIWINRDSIPSSVYADDKNEGLFYNSTKEECENNDNINCMVVLGKNNLMPGRTFEFTFAKPGVFGYHSVPHPQMKGTVIVNAQNCLTSSDIKCIISTKPKVELTIGGLRDSYKVGEIIDVSATQKGGACTRPEILVLDQNQKIIFVSKNDAIISCPALSLNEWTHFSLSWTPYSNGHPIIMNQTGRYTMLAEYDGMGIEQQFIVVK